MRYFLYWYQEKQMAGYLVAPAFTLVGGGRRAPQPRSFTFIYESGRKRTKCVHSKDEDGRDQWKSYGKKTKRTWSYRPGRRSYIDGDDGTRYENIVVVNPSFAIGFVAKQQRKKLICLVDHGMDVPERRLPQSTKMSFDDATLEIWRDLGEALQERRSSTAVVADFIRSYESRVEDHKKRALGLLRRMKRRRSDYTRMQADAIVSVRRYINQKKASYGYTGSNTADAFVRFLDDKVTEAKAHLAQRPLVDAHFIMCLVNEYSDLFRINADDDVWKPRIHEVGETYDMHIPCYPGPDMATLRTRIRKKRKLSPASVKELVQLYRWYACIDSLSLRGGGKGKGLRGP